MFGEQYDVSELDTNAKMVEAGFQVETKWFI